MASAERGGTVPSLQQRSVSRADRSKRTILRRASRRLLAPCAYRYVSFEGKVHCPADPRSIIPGEVGTRARKRLRRQSSRSFPKAFIGIDIEIAGARRATRQAIKKHAAPRFSLTPPPSLSLFLVKTINIRPFDFICTQGVRGRVKTGLGCETAVLLDR